MIPEEVEGFFAEFRPFVALCAFPDCTHTHEDRCAVKRAVMRRWITRIEIYQLSGIIRGGNGVKTTSREHQRAGLGKPARWRSRRVFLFIPQRINRIEPRRLPGGIEAEDQTDRRRDADGDDDGRAPKRPPASAGIATP